MATTKDAAITRFQEAMQFLHRTLKFIKANKQLHSSGRSEAALPYREIVDTLEECIESHLKEWDPSSTTEE